MRDHGWCRTNCASCGPSDRWTPRPKPWKNGWTKGYDTVQDAEVTPCPKPQGLAMYVNRMHLFNVKPLNQAIPEGGEPFPEPARRRLVLQGANGSGKSTILETILMLWKFWGEWIEEGRD